MKISMIDWIRLAAARLICRMFGHRWVSDDYGGPESGGCGATCQRCGESWHETLY